MEKTAWQLLQAFAIPPLAFLLPARPFILVILRLQILVLFPKKTLIFTILFYYLTIQSRKKLVQKRCLDIFSLVFAFLSQVPRAFGSTAMEAARSLWRCQGQCEQLPCNLVSQTNTLSFFCLPEGQGKKKAQAEQAVYIGCKKARKELQHDITSLLLALCHCQQPTQLTGGIELQTCNEGQYGH